MLTMRTTPPVLWFAEKFVSLLIEQHRWRSRSCPRSCCDLLKNSYLCLLNNTSAVTASSCSLLWFAEKFVSLLIEQHQTSCQSAMSDCCDLLKNSYLCLLNNTGQRSGGDSLPVVICWKIRIFAYWTTPGKRGSWASARCDLLKNSYLCLLNNTPGKTSRPTLSVVICWKIRIFAYWTTPSFTPSCGLCALWFAEKFVSLLIEQHLIFSAGLWASCCDLLKNSYLCLLNNTACLRRERGERVVICWKIRIFAYWTTPVGWRGDNDFGCDLLKNSYLCLLNNTHIKITSNVRALCCDLLKNSYLCLLNNTCHHTPKSVKFVVICWKIRIFAYWTTPRYPLNA